MRAIRWGFCLLGTSVVSWAGGDPKPTALELYIQEATKRGAESPFSPGSLYSPGARLGEMGRDLRASQVDDLVTIVVSDSASALSKGTTSTDRKTSAKASITAAAGLLKSTGPLANLAGMTGDQSLAGQGQTTRQTTLTTTLSARVTHVLPNGYLVVEGVKDILVNSERQQVTVRGVIRWNDIAGTNQVRSERLANLEVKVMGKGVVNDAIRRPNFLYRLLLGVLPF